MYGEQPISDATEGITAQMISQGIANNEFHLVYQPLSAAVDGSLAGFEALMRWDSAILGPVSPEQFIRAAENDNCIVELWNNLLSTIAADWGTLGGMAPASMHIAINLSPCQLSDTNLSNSFSQWLLENDIDGSQIHIEITESAIFENDQTVTENLFSLREMGIMIWMDDFGTGFSSLRHLRDLPISGLKIDKSFIADIESSLADFRIVSAIVAMANSLGLKVVGEGVETSNQLQILTQLGCNYLQGYLIGHPSRLDEVEQNWPTGSTS